MAFRFSDGEHAVRAKIYVGDVSNVQSGYVGDDGPRQNPKREIVTFRFVNGNDPDGENSKFWDASPEGNPWQMTIANPGAQGIFKAGEEYYVDFVRAVRTKVEDA